MQHFYGIKQTAFFAGVRVFYGCNVIRTSGSQAPLKDGTLRRPAPLPACLFLGLESGSMSDTSGLALGACTEGGGLVSSSSGGRGPTGHTGGPRPASSCSRTLGGGGPGPAWLFLLRPCLHLARKLQNTHTNL
jgi:hypothetical protein